MSWSQAVVLAVVQGLTEFLPVSSSGHLAIVSRVFFAGDAGASFTAVTQLGTEAAVLVYFARDIVRIVTACFSGLRAAAHRTADYWLGWYVIIGTIPICVLGLFFKDEIRSGVRNLWVIATALVVFSAVIALAERIGRQSRDVEQLTWRDAVVVGIAQTLALVPGVSRSGATISAGLFLGVVLTARRVPSGFRGYERDRTATGGGNCDRLRRGPGRGGMVSAVSGAPQHVLVRRLPGGGRRSRAHPVGHRGGERDVTAGDDQQGSDAEERRI
jgi:undecaprenyl-diphosphatase UppP